ncbi:MAG: hypothetical protein JWP63_3140 [Candidatus Solibacter sp.]|jgi:hypothetical protein|nr:hypothetical protein [Candidatus Solibacter sp.]
MGYPLQRSRAGVHVGRRDRFRINGERYGGIDSMVSRRRSIMAVRLVSGLCQGLPPHFVSGDIIAASLLRPWQYSPPAVAFEFDGRFGRATVRGVIVHLPR